MFCGAVLGCNYNFSVHNIKKRSSAFTKQNRGLTSIFKNESMR